MKTLIIHHLESIWEEAYMSRGESFESLCMKFTEHIENNHFDRVILTRFEDDRLEAEHIYSGLGEHINQVYPYAYGWDEECKGEHDRNEWCEGGNHSEIVLIDEWMKDLRGDVSISGAFDGECIEDLEIALSHLDIDFKRIESLII